MLTLILIIVCAWLGARACTFIHCPPILGMLLGGILAQGVGPHLPGMGVNIQTISGPIRFGILALIILRAGLSLKLKTIRKSGLLAVKIGVIPLLFEMTIVTLACCWVFQMSLKDAAVIGSVVGAISPAIIMPMLLQKTNKKPLHETLLIGLPLDNTLALVCLGIALNIALQGSGTIMTLLASIPYSLGAGVGLGMIAGGMGLLMVKSRLFLESHPLTLWGVAILTLWASLKLNLSFVMALLSMGLVLNRGLSKENKSIERAIGIWWDRIQYALFGLIAYTLPLAPLMKIGVVMCGIIMLGQCARACGMLASVMRSRLPTNERIEAMTTYIPKATIQAAMAGVPLQQGFIHGERCLILGVLSIFITVPLGLFMQEIYDKTA